MNSGRDIKLIQPTKNQCLIKCKTETQTFFKKKNKTIKKISHDF